MWLFFSKLCTAALENTSEASRMEASAVVDKEASMLVDVDADIVVIFHCPACRACFGVAATAASEVASTAEASASDILEASAEAYASEIALSASCMPSGSCYWSFRLHAGEKRREPRATESALQRSASRR